MTGGARLTAALCVSALALAFCPGAAQGATFPAACSGTTGDAASLVAAITSANATAGADTVGLGQGCLYTLTTPDNNWYGPNGLPAIASDITIEANGSTIDRPSSTQVGNVIFFTPNFRLFFVGAGSTGPNAGYVSPPPGPGRLTLRDVTLSGGSAEGGNSTGGGGGGRGAGVGGDGPGGGGGGLGGAIFNMQGELTLHSSTLTENTTVGGTGGASNDGKAIGGAVFNLSGSFTAVGSTFAANTAAGDGASIYNLVYDGVTARTAQTTLRDTIVAGGLGPVDLASDKPAGVIGTVNLGSADAGVGEFDLVRSTAVVGTGTISGSPLTAEPLLGPLQDNGGPAQTMAPAAGSPVVDAGSAFGLVTDQRGLPRPSDFFAIANAGDSSDIGALELQSPDRLPARAAGWQRPAAPASARRSSVRAGPTG